MIWRWNGHHWNSLALHNSRLGVPGIIACNGPSLKDVDASRIVGRGRVVIGVNNVYPTIRPDYWIGLDTPDNFDAGLCWESFPKIFRGGLRAVNFAGHPLKELHNTCFADILESGNFWDWTEGADFHHSGDSFTCALQLALWLGIRRLAFVGVDLHHKSGDYADGSYLTPEQRATNDSVHRRIVGFMEKFVPQAKTLGIECVSCSKTSALNRLMPHTDFAEVVATCEHGAPSGRQKLHNTALLREERNVVLVLRSGGEYRPEHVARLAAQLTDCTITVLTNYPVSQFSGVRVIPLLYGWPGWWSKMELFRPELKGSFLYLDLDTTVLDRLPDAYWRGDSTMLRLWDDEAEEDWLYGSGFMFLKEDDRKKVWQQWQMDPISAMAVSDRPAGKLHPVGGDQAFISRVLHPASWQDRFPNEIVSYKMNWMAGKARNGGALNARKVKVVCFHGQPRPWDIPEITRAAKPGAKPNLDLASLADCCPDGACGEKLAAALTAPEAPAPPQTAPVPAALPVPA